MAIDNSADSQPDKPSRLETQAFRLWAFVHKRAAGFSRDQALAALRELEPTDNEGIKPFARRLQRVLEKHRVQLAHTAAIQASALVLQDQDWHRVRQYQLIHSLNLCPFTDKPDEPIADWNQAGQRLAVLCEEHIQQHPGVQAFQIEAAPNGLVISVLEIGVDQGNRGWLAMPIAIITPTRSDDRWLAGAASGLEKLRRRLEETHMAVLDGLAVIAWRDGREQNRPAAPTIAVNDALNSEIVLTREDDPHSPGSGYEITRGDELACWTQFELAVEGKPAAPITVDEGGAWICGDARFVWDMVTLNAKEFTLGLASKRIEAADATRLLRRYRLAKRIFGRNLQPRVGRKRLDYLGSPAETYRMDLQKLRLAMAGAGLTWEDYCNEVGEAGRDMTPELPLGFTLPLLERLGVDDPDSVFARPARSDLARANDDLVLRALLPRVDHVRYRVCRGLTASTLDSVRDAVAELSSTILMRLGVFQTDDPLPDLVYGNDGQELMAKLDELDLEAYVGVMPHLRKMPKDADLPPGGIPFAFGHSLYLDIDLRST